MLNSHKTAITRKKLSSPMQFLLDTNKLSGEILDYGCGKGFDVDFLKAQGHSIIGFDPYYRSLRTAKKFNTITCNYVLNVVSEAEQTDIIEDIKSKLVSGGKAYFAVRRDKFTEGINSKGLYQRRVFLNDNNVKLIIETSNYALYELQLN